MKGDMSMLLEKFQELTLEEKLIVLAYVEEILCTQKPESSQRQ